MNRVFKSMALHALRGSGVNALLRRRTGSALRILAYHGVDARAERPENFDGFQVHPETFRRQLDRIGRLFRVVRLSDALQRGSWPERALAITFDDGYLNNIETAAPILEEFGMPATFFVTTGFLDGRCAPWWYVLRAWACERKESPARIAAMEAEWKDLSNAEREARQASLGPSTGPLPYPLMKWSDARRLAERGFEVAPHTVTHINLNRESSDVIRSEIGESTRTVAEQTGTRPVAFSYPYGRPQDISEDAIAAVRAAGCLGAVTTAEGLNGPGGDPFRLFRLNVTDNHSGPAFDWLVSRGY